MDDLARLSAWKMALIAVALTALACNAPLPMLEFFKLNSGKSADDDFASGVMKGLTATLVDEEGQLLPLNATTWKCRDVDGEVSNLKRNADALESRKLLQTDFDLSLALSGDKSGRYLDLRYGYAFSTADPVVDGVTGEIVDWNTSKWSGVVDWGSFQVTDQGTFSGTFAVDERRETDYPQRIVSTVVEKHNVFGLIPKGDNSTAYFCDLANIPVPGLQGLTPENFQSRCQLYYYECDVN
jgi:hypothetical protein